MKLLAVLVCCLAGTALSAPPMVVTEAPPSAETQAPELIPAVSEEAGLTTTPLLPEETSASSPAAAVDEVAAVTENPEGTAVNDGAPASADFTDDALVLTTEEPLAAAVEETTTAVPPPPTPTPRLSAVQRQALIGHLATVNLQGTDRLVLSERQRLALQQELEYRRLGLTAFTDPTAWERLSADQQLAFNAKFRSLRPELQAYSSKQFQQLPEDIVEHAFAMFLDLDVEVLSQVLEKEMEQERLSAAEEASKKRAEAEQQRLLLQQQQEQQERLRQQQQQQLLLQQQQEQQQRSRLPSVINQQQSINQNQFPAVPNRFAPPQASQQEAFFSQSLASAAEPVETARRPAFDPRRRQPVAQQQLTSSNQDFSSQFQQFGTQFSSQQLARQQSQQQFIGQQQQQFLGQQQQQQQQFFGQQQQQFFGQEQQQPKQLTAAELRHQQQQQQLIDEAVKLQNSLAFPSTI